MKSLLLLAFPRSMSSLIARIAGDALRHQLPDQGPAESRERLHKTTMQDGWIQSYETDYRKYPGYEKYIEKWEYNSLWKDVHQPFMCRRYLDENPGAYNVLFIRRPLEDIAYCMALAGWWWPILALCRNMPSARDIFLKSESLSKQHGLCDYHYAHSLPLLLRGLVHTNRVCYQPVKKKVYYDKLIWDSEHLWEAISELGYTPIEHNYINDTFKRDRDKRLEYRNTELWHVIKGMLQHIRQCF